MDLERSPSESAIDQKHRNASPPRSPLAAVARSPSESQLNEVVMQAAVHGSPPRSPLTIRSRSSSNLNLQNVLQRRGSSSDLSILVGRKWEMSPQTRRDSLIFRRENESPSHSPYASPRTSPHASPIGSPRSSQNMTPSSPPSAIPFPELEDGTVKFSTLEDAAREGLIEAAYGGTEFGWALLEVQDKVWIHRKKLEGTVDAFKNE